MGNCSCWSSYRRQRKSMLREAGEIDVPAIAPDVILLFCIISFIFIKISLRPCMETRTPTHEYVRTCALRACILESLGALQVALCLLQLFQCFSSFWLHSLVNLCLQRLHGSLDRGSRSFLSCAQLPVRPLPSSSALAFPFYLILLPTPNPHTVHVTVWARWTVS